MESAALVGTGVYGSAHPRSLNVGFRPKLVIVVADPNGQWDHPGTFGFFIDGQRYAQTLTYTGGQGGGIYNAALTWSSTGVSWHADEYAVQLEQEGLTYRYVAIG